MNDHEQSMKKMAEYAMMAKAAPVKTWSATHKPYDIRRKTDGVRDTGTGEKTQRKDS